MPIVSEPEKACLAVFDVDGTLIPQQSQKLLVIYLIKKRMLPAGIFISVMRALFCYKLGIKVDMQKEKQRVLQFFQGMSLVQANEIIKDFVTEKLLPIIRRDAIDEIKRMKAQNMKVLLVSSTVEPIIAYLAHMLQADGHIATRLQVVEEKLTGKIEGDVVMGQHKPRLLDLYANQRYGDWELSYAYGDHRSDIPLLESARYPVAVCPDSLLRNQALQSGWQCHVWQ